MSRNWHLSRHGLKTYDRSLWLYDLIFNHIWLILQRKGTYIDEEWSCIWSNIIHSVLMFIVFILMFIFYCVETHFYWSYYFLFFLSPHHLLIHCAWLLYCFSFSWLLVNCFCILILKGKRSIAGYEWDDLKVAFFTYVAT